MLSSYKRLFHEIVDCSAPFRPPFHAICNRFASGELIIPGTNLNIFNSFLKKCMLIDPVYKSLTVKAYNMDLQAMLELIPIVNDKDAIYLAYEASTRNDTKALCYLGMCYEQGRGILKNKDMAMKYYEIAKDKGDLNGLFNFGKLLYENNPEEGLKLLKEEADKGVVEAALKYAELADDKRYYDAAYLNLKGVNKREAIKSYSSHYLELKYCQDLMSTSQKIKQMETYAKDGNDIVAYELGTILTSKPEKALEYYKIAANSGNKDALFKIGMFYNEGIAVPKDSNLAYLYFKRALEANGKFSSEACQYFKNYRDFGHKNECFLYGYCQYNGEGCKKNQERGIMTIERSIELGSTDGSFFIKKIEWDKAQQSIKERKLEIQRINKEKELDKEDADDKDPQSGIKKETSNSYFEEDIEEYEEELDQNIEEEEDNEEIHSLKLELKEKIMKEAKDLSEKGSIDAAVFCAKCFHSGEYYFNKDESQSLHYLKIASNINSIEGIFYYGVHLLYGTPDERETGYHILLKAKDFGNMNIETILAACLRDGYCVKKSTKQSRAIFEKLAPKCPLAKAYLSLSYIAVFLNERDMHTAATLAEEAKNESPDAMFILGKCYAEGLGITKDENEARKCFIKATRGQLIIRQQDIEYKPYETEAYRYFSSNPKWIEFAKFCSPINETIN